MAMPVSAPAIDAVCTVSIGEYGVSGWAENTFMYAL